MRAKRMGREEEEEGARIVNLEERFVSTRLVFRIGVQVFGLL